MITIHPKLKSKHIPKDMPLQFWYRSNWPKHPHHWFRFYDEDSYDFMWTYTFPWSDIRSRIFGMRSSRTKPMVFHYCSPKYSLYLGPNYWIRPISNKQVLWCRPSPKTIVKSTKTRL